MDDITKGNKKLSLSAVMLISLLSMSFGANTVAVKICLKGVGAFTAVGLRFSIAAITIILWALFTGRSLKIEKGQLSKLFVVSVLLTAQLGLFYFGMTKTNASRGTLIANLQPFLVLILAHFFIPGDKITGRKIIGMVLGFVGVTFVVLEGKNTPGDFLTGDFFVFSAVVFWACNAIYTKKIIAGFKSYLLTLYPILFSIPAFFIAAAIWDHQFFGRIDKTVTAAILYQGLVTASFGYLLWNALLKKYGAVSMNSFIFILPVTGVSLGGTVLGEPIHTSNIFWSLFFITAGILMLHVRLGNWRKRTYQVAQKTDKHVFLMLDKIAPTRDIAAEKVDSLVQTIGDRLAKTNTANTKKSAAD